MTLLDGLRLRQQGAWDRAHRLAQADATRRGSWLQGSVHLAEPAEGNARYR